MSAPIRKKKGGSIYMKTIMTKKISIHFNSLGNNLEQILSEQIKGPIGFVFSNDEASSVTKSIFDFTEKNNVPFIVKIGLLNDELVDEVTLLKLSKLPSKEVLLSKLIGNMNSPISNFVFLMSANVRSFVNVLQRHIEETVAEEPKEETAAEEPKEETVAEEPKEEK